MSKHTPGPWEVGDDGISTPYVGDRIHVETGETCREADARLIAASPDLLAACEEAEKSIHGDSPLTQDQVLAVLRAAITKATRQGSSCD